MSTELTTAGPRWRRVLRRLLGAIVTLLIIALLVRLGLGYATARQLQAELAKIRAAGEALTLKDLRAASPVDDADDAWPFYEAALALVRQEGLTEAWKASCAGLRATADATATEPESSAPLHGAERILEDNALTLDLLRRGAERPACRADIGIEQGLPFCVERLKHARMAVKLLSLHTHVCIARGDGNGAVEAIVCSLRLLRMFDQQPILLAYLVQVAAMQQAAEDAQFVLQLCVPQDAALVNLQPALLEAETGMPALERLALAERAFGVESMRKLIAAGLDPWAEPVGATPEPASWPTLGWWSQPWVQRRTVGYLRFMADFATATRKPWSEVLSEASTLEQGRPPFDQFPGQALARAIHLAARSIALIRCSATAAMIERYRRENGVLPSSLADLTPTYGDSVPSDPFNGEDLRYRAEAGCYVVYSIGADGVDNEGAVVAQKEGEDPRDVGLRVRLSTTP